jgi:protein SHQ1
LADLYDNNELEDEILLYNPETDYIDADYDEKQFDILQKLPKRTYLLSKEQKFEAYAGLIDILFAYCYNRRINCGCPNVESAWTISKVSSTLSWFETFKTIKSVIVASFRRALSIPLYRNWKLNELVLHDVINILSKGHKSILKCLIEIRETFVDGECRYILNDLYINDYCTWIQYVRYTFKLINIKLLKFKLIKNLFLKKVLNELKT